VFNSNNDAKTNNINYYNMLVSMTNLNSGPASVDL